MRMPLLLVVVACSYSEPAPRSRDELLAQLQGSAHDVRPPTEQELAWIGDRADQDPLVRAKQAVMLLRRETAIDLSYAGHEHAAVRWRRAELETCALLADVIVDEVTPRPAAHANEDLAARELAPTVADLVLVLLQNPRSPDERRVTSDTFHAHAPSFRKLLSAADCERIAATAPTLAGDLHDCTGAVR